MITPSEEENLLTELQQLESSLENIIILIIILVTVVVDSKNIKTVDFTRSKLRLVLVN